MFYKFLLNSAKLLMAIYLLSTTLVSVICFAFLLSSQKGKDILFSPIKFGPLSLFLNEIVESPSNFFSIISKNGDSIIEMGGLGYLWPLLTILIGTILYFLFSKGIFTHLFSSLNLKCGFGVFVGFYISLCIYVCLFSLPLDLMTKYRNPFFYLFLLLFTVCTALFAIKKFETKKTLIFCFRFLLRFLIHNFFSVPLIFVMFFISSYQATAPGLCLAEMVNQTSGTLHAPNWLVSAMKLLYQISILTVVPANLVAFVLILFLLIGDAYLYAKDKVTSPESQFF